MRDRATGWIELHAGELFLLWTALGLGRLPATLGVPHFGRTPAARAEWVAAADRSLSDRELGTVAEPSDDLEDLLRIIAGGERLLELDVDTPASSLRGIGATGAVGTAAVARVDTMIRIGPARSTNLVETMLEVPPPLGAGRGISANLPVADFEAACGAGARDGVAGFVNELTYLGLRGPEINTLARALGSRTGGGRLGAKVRIGDGNWQRAESPVNWVDAEDGRYSVRRSGDWVTVTPVDQRRLITMAEEMVSSLA